MKKNLIWIVVIFLVFFIGTLLTGAYLYDTTKLQSFSAALIFVGAFGGIACLGAFIIAIGVENA